jgi:hypothetical protein
MHDHHAQELYRRHPSIDPARGILEDRRLPKAFHEKRLAQMREMLATRNKAQQLPGRWGQRGGGAEARSADAKATDRSPKVGKRFRR